MQPLSLPFKFSHELPKGCEKDVLIYDRKLTRVEIKSALTCSSVDVALFPLLTQEILSILMIMLNLE